MSRQNIQEEGSRKIAWWFSLLLLIIGFGVGYMVGIGSLAKQEPVSTDTEEQASNDSVPVVEISGGYELVVDEQSAGLEVTISKVHMVADGWVAVRENNGGTPGKILGAQFFGKGTSGGAVSLLRPTDAGISYIAEIWSDNGDHTFSLTDDMPIKTTNGTVRSSFTTLEKSAPLRNDTSQ